MPAEPAVALRRSLGVVLLVMFGLGNILGAGIYVLVGKVAGEAGYLAPLSFLVAALVALFSALSYSELTARYPDAGGEVVYIDRAFGIRVLSLGVGLLIAAAGMLSAAAIVKGFTGYVQVFWHAPMEVIIELAVVGLVSVAVWGVRESLLIAAVFTVVEAAGLLLVIVPAALEPGHWIEVLAHWPSEPGSPGLAGLLPAAFLALYAFLGFEDMVNLAEEAKNPQRDMPLAIILALLVSTVFYVLTVWAALAYMTPAELDASSAPLTDVYQRVTAHSPALLTLIAIFAVINGALVQLVMVSRLLYGMGKRARLFAVFSRVSARTRTPVISTVAAGGIILSLALWFPVRRLAEYTSGLVLVVFVLVNLSLIAVKHRQPMAEGVRSIPWWVPVVGVVTTLSMLLYIGWHEIAG